MKLSDIADNAGSRKKRMRVGRGIGSGKGQQAVDAKAIDAKDTVNAESLVKAGVLRRAKAGVRLLGRGELKAKLNIEVHGASKSAIAAVEKAGGSVKILAPAKE